MDALSTEIAAKQQQNKPQTTGGVIAPGGPMGVRSVNPDPRGFAVQVPVSPHVALCRFLSVSLGESARLTRVPER